MNTQNITSLDGSCYEAINSSISQNIFSYLKMFSICRKNITVVDNKKRMNVANFINRYTFITYDENDSINLVLQHGRVVDNSCCVVFPSVKISIFDPVSQILQMEGSYHLLSYKN